VGIRLDVQRFKCDGCESVFRGRPPGDRRRQERTRLFSPRQTPANMPKKSLGTTDCATRLSL
jgi:hypothetical protein